jgi:two-component system, NtrC family, sensor kinase
MRIHFLLAAMFALLRPAAAQFVLEGEVRSNQLIRSGISFVEDPSGTLTFTQVAQLGTFVPVSDETPNFGISQSVFWLKIQLLNRTDEVRYLLQVSQPALDEIDFWHRQADGNLHYVRGGECRPFNEREYFDPNYIFSVRLDTGRVNEIYIRLSSKDNLKIPVLIGTQKTIQETNKIRDFIFGLFAGIMLVMFLYNAFIYATVRDNTYLYYILYLATVILTQISIQGYTFQYLWPESTWLAQWSPFIFSPAVGIGAALFMRVFLNTRYYVPRFDAGFIYFFMAYAAAVVLAIAGLFHISYFLITMVASLLSMYMLVAAVFVFRRGYKPARFFLLAWSLFLFGVTVYAMTNLGLLPLNNFTFYVMPLGAAAEVVLLSLALADRINVLKKEKEQSQAEALLISQQNQKLISEQNVVLEQKVHERTLELEETNEELQTTLVNLKDAQAQLVNAEKMASLGQLTAGIAHEINNPINFVSANLKPLRTDIQEVIEVVSIYDSIKSKDDLDKGLREVESFKKRVDYDYLTAEINTLLNGIEDGAKRTAEIVSGLKNFSRLDESDLKEANINEGIESTLIILRSSIPRNVEVITKLGSLPSIECYPGKLNQVFMNLMTNAVYAMSKQTKHEKNRLTITTFFKDEKVYAVFEDTGIGMTKEVMDKIFEPFFTTKDVGEGTGLGMSIVFKIIESHKAKIEVESEPGSGTKITLALNLRITGTRA